MAGLKVDQSIEVINKLRFATRGMLPPASRLIKNKYGDNPYLTLVGCVLSLRTKDSVSFSAACRLFEYAQTPEQLVDMPLDRIQQLIYPVGFYRVKARQLVKMSQSLIEQFNSLVPANEQDLLSLPGVGQKTANLVLGEAFGVPALCVDTHVHRISNRLGLVKTKTPAQTEQALKAIIPPEYWIEYNYLIVMWGQNICVPISPFCSRCPIFDLCERRGVGKAR